MPSDETDDKTYNSSETETNDDDDGKNHWKTLNNPKLMKKAKEN